MCLLLIMIIQIMMILQTQYRVDQLQSTNQMEEEVVLTILKLAFMVLFFVIVAVVGSIPLRAKVFKTNPKLRAMGTTFAGALFINVAIIHILPEAAATLQEYLRGDSDEEVFPLANLLLICGFLITVFFTKIISKHSHGDQHDHDHHHDHHHDNSHSDGSSINAMNNPSLLQSKNVSLLSQIDVQPVATGSTLNEAYFLTLAIYFHTIFEGIAIGVQDNLSGFLSTAVAIGFHKWADALSMGIHYRSKNVQPKIAYILIFGQAALNSIAIAAGWLISQEGPVVEAVFLSISAGTFLAISTMEMLGEQLNRREYIWQKFFILIVATGFISSVWFVQNRLFVDNGGDQ